MNAVRDENRGIQNVQERVSELPTRETVGERHLRGGKWKTNVGTSAEAANDARVIQATNDERAYFVAAAIQEQEEENLRAQEQIQQTLIEKSKKLLLKTTLGKKTLFARSSIRSTLGIALTAYLFQLLFAVGALLGFGAQGMALYIKKETTGGQLLGILIDFDKYLPFEGLGYVFWGLGLLLSICIFIGYLLFFRFIGVSVLQSSTTALISITCFAFNITPGINLLPWLLIWVIYMSLFSSSE